MAIAYRGIKLCIQINLKSCSYKAIGKGFNRRRNHLTLVIHGFTPHTIRHAIHDRKLKLKVILLGVILKLAVRYSTELARRLHCKVNYSILLKLRNIGPRVQWLSARLYRRPPAQCKVEMSDIRGLTVIVSFLNSCIIFF